MTSPRRFLLPVLLAGLFAAACSSSASTDVTSPVPNDTPEAAESLDSNDPTPAPTVTPEVEASPETEITPEPEPTVDEPEPTSTPEPAPTPVPEALSVESVVLEFTTVIETSSVPLAMAAHPDGESLLVAEKGGAVRRWLPQPDSTYERVDPPVVDLSDRVSSGNEQGLLGLAVAPAGDFLYLVYTDTGGDNQLAEFTIDGTDERELLVVPQPFANHNGGHIEFGPDGYLYYGLGDGGAGGDPFDTGQDRSDLLGSILRIAPNPGGDSYAIPSDNPFLDEAAARPEVWAYGLRNPWRFSFDPANGDLWIADVGQEEIEEIDWLPAEGDDLGAGAGANLGWPAFEGTVPYRSASAPDAIDPIHQYNHDVGCSVTGGHVARGNHPDIEGVYLFGDYCSRTVFGLIDDNNGAVTSVGAIGSVGGGLVSFGRGHDGELFVMLDSGEVQRITLA